MLTNAFGAIATEETLEQIASAVGTRDEPAAADQHGIAVFAVRRDSDTIPTDDGDLSMLRVDEEGRLKVASKPPSFALCRGALTSTAAVASATTGDVATAAGYLAVNVARASNIMMHVRNTGTAAMSAGAAVNTKEVEPDHLRGQITSVEDVKGRGMYIEVLAKGVKPSG